MQLTGLLLETKAATLSFYELSAADLEKTYAPGKWTIRQILVHLADAESVLHERIKRIIAEPGQVIWAFDQDQWSKKLDYTNFPLEISRNLYAANRDSIIYLAEQFYSSLGDITFIHSQTGKRTLKDEFDKVAWHNESHLQQIRAALLT